MAKNQRVEKEERQRLMSMTKKFPCYSLYIKKVALCDNIDTVQHVIRWLENKKVDKE